MGGDCDAADAVVVGGEVAREESWESEAVKSWIFWTSTLVVCGPR